jgi:hypothetical protein
MRLGIHVNTKRHMKELLSITRAAVEAGHDVSVFIMGEGIELIAVKEMAELAEIPGVDLSFCEYNAMNMDIQRGSFPSSIRAGSQLDNALMVRDSNRVISL